MSASRSRHSSAAARNKAARSYREVCDHGPNAALAAATASAVSSSEASGASPITSSVAGLTIE